MSAHSSPSILALARGTCEAAGSLLDWPCTGPRRLRISHSTGAALVATPHPGDASQIATHDAGALRGSADVGVRAVPHAVRMPRPRPPSPGRRLRRDPTPACRWAPLALLTAALPMIIASMGCHRWGALGAIDTAIPVALARSGFPAGALDSRKPPSTGRRASLPCSAEIGAPAPSTPRPSAPVSARLVSREANPRRNAGDRRTGWEQAGAPGHQHIDCYTLGSRRTPQLRNLPKS